MKVAHDVLRLHLGLKFAAADRAAVSNSAKAPVSKYPARFQEAGLP
jgi:hypothetical protein